MFVKAPRSWVSTPLGVNILLALCKNKGPSVEKYIRINSSLRNNEICTVKNKIFYSSSYQLKDVGEVISEKVDFRSGDAKNVIAQWVNQYEYFGKIEEWFSSDTALALINVSEIKGKWNTENKSPIMKIYNSFNYTQDVKYEARLLELPLEDNDFKLVIIVPNEIDTLQNLVNILTDKGLEEAVKSIQPLFTATSELTAPKIQFQSEIVNLNNVNNKLAVQYGGVDINENGVYAKIRH